jgi:hypothetical protein
VQRIAVGARDLRELGGRVRLEHGPQREAVDERLGQHALVGRGADDRDVRELENARRGDEPAILENVEQDFRVRLRGPAAAIGDRLLVDLVDEQHVAQVHHERSSMRVSVEIGACTW